MLPVNQFSCHTNMCMWVYVGPGVSVNFKSCGLEPSWFKLIARLIAWHMEQDPFPPTIHPPNSLLVATIVYSAKGECFIHDHENHSNIVRPLNPLTTSCKFHYWLVDMQCSWRHLWLCLAEGRSRDTLILVDHDPLQDLNREWHYGRNRQKFCLADFLYTSTCMTTWS